MSECNVHMSIYRDWGQCSLIYDVSELEKRALDSVSQLTNAL